MKIKLDLSKLDTQAKIEALRCAAVAILSALPRDEAELAFLEWRAVRRVRSSDDEVAEPKAEQEDWPLPPFGVGSMVQVTDGRLGMVTSPGPYRTWVRFESSMPDEPIPNDCLVLANDKASGTGECDTSQEAGPSEDAGSGWHGDTSQDAGEISPARAAL